MTTHYYPYLNDVDDLEQFPCGALVGEASNITTSWKFVDCGRCLRGKKRITTTIESEEAEIVKQMGDMAEFMSRQSI